MNSIIVLCLLLVSIVSVESKKLKFADKDNCEGY